MDIFQEMDHISNNSIEASSSSKRLIEGINMLCSRRLEYFWKSI